MTNDRLLRKSADVARVEAALLLRLLFPPPPPGTLVLTRVRCSRARFASNRNETAVVQCVVGNVVIADVAPYLLRRPKAQRVEFHQRLLRRAERAIELDDGNIGARAGTLILPLAGHPRAKRCERPRQRFHLA